MKTNHFLKLCATLIVAVTVCTSCVTVTMGDNDTTPTQVPTKGLLTTMEPFSKVSVSNSFRVIYNQGPAHSVRIEASAQAFKAMTVYVRGNMLCIRKAVMKLPEGVDLADVKVYVTSPNLESVEMAGSGVFSASKAIKVDNLDTEIAGSGKIHLANLDCRHAGMEIAGSGDIQVEKLNAANVSAQIAGSGDILIGKAECDKVGIEIAGSGNVSSSNLTANDVHTEIAGSGNVILKGNIARHTEDVAGSGTVTISQAR